MTLLVALAGQSRSGKGTCAAVFAEEAAKLGKSSLERQLSDNGKWALARIFRPTISRVDAVAMWEAMKTSNYPVSIGIDTLEGIEQVPLQKFLQHGLQQGGRDIFGEDIWTDRLIQYMDGDSPYSQRWDAEIVDNKPVAWLDTFFDDEAGVEPTDLAIISDLRQPNEAQRVRDLGGIVIECKRSRIDDAYRTGSDHITERELSRELVDTTIYNDGDLDGLKISSQTAFDHLIRPRL